VSDGTVEDVGIRISEAIEGLTEAIFHFALAGANDIEH